MRRTVPVGREFWPGLDFRRAGPGRGGGEEMALINLQAWMNEQMLQSIAL